MGVATKTRTMPTSTAIDVGIASTRHSQSKRFIYRLLYVGFDGPLGGERIIIHIHYRIVYAKSQGMRKNIRRAGLFFSFWVRT